MFIPTKYVLRKCSIFVLKVYWRMNISIDSILKWHNKLNTKWHQKGARSNALIPLSMSEFLHDWIICELNGCFFLVGAVIPATFWEITIEEFSLYSMRRIIPLLDALFSITTNAALHSSILRSLRITLCMPARSHKFIFTLYWLFHKTMKRARKKVGAGFAQCVKMLWLCQLMT